MFTALKPVGSVLKEIITAPPRKIIHSLPRSGWTALAATLRGAMLLRDGYEAEVQISTRHFTLPGNHIMPNDIRRLGFKGVEVVHSHSGPGKEQLRLGRPRRRVLMTRDPLGFWISSAKHNPATKQLLLARQVSGDVLVDDALFLEVSNTVDLCAQYVRFNHLAISQLTRSKESDQSILLHTRDPKKSDLRRRASIVAEWLQLGVESFQVEYVAKQLDFSKISPLMTRSSPRSSTLRVVMESSVEAQILALCEPVHQELRKFVTAEH